ncbi:MAG: nucleoid-associated protein YgaU [Phenylobacterium sp.]|jgi:nucleoid-associated protein YgaU
MVDKLKIKQEGGNKEFSVQLNPGSIKRSHGINYSDKSKFPVGSISSEYRYAKNDPELLDFELMFDGTGAVIETSLNPFKMKEKSVQAQIDELKELVYRYDGNEHETPIVEILWGTLHFNCRLAKMNVEYVLFDAKGAPLRAKVQLTFLRYMTIEDADAIMRKSSPDLTHIIEVKAGDTLPLLCQQIYRDSAYHTVVARHNNLTSLRHLEPGTRLYFPPLQ